MTHQTKPEQPTNVRLVLTDGTRLPCRTTYLGLDDKHCHIWLATPIEDRISITCPRCNRTSHHPEDVRNGYCGNCHDWTDGHLSATIRSMEVEKLPAHTGIQVDLLGWGPTNR